MPKPPKGPRLGSGPAHEKLMLAGLATALFEHGRIKTTETKAKRLRPFAEKLITFARRGDLHARRQVLTTIRDKSVVHTLFTEIGPRYESRPGGYTRITKIGPRKGDNAPMAVIELVEGPPAAPSHEAPTETVSAEPAATGAVAAGSAESTTVDEGTPADEAAAVEEGAEERADETESPAEETTEEGPAEEAGEDDKGR